MRAMVLEAPGTSLVLREVDDPRAGPGQVVLRVLACGVCRTDLHIVDGELPPRDHPVILGHQVVGTVTAVGEGVDELRPGQRVGLPWLGATCGRCDYCQSDRENLCDEGLFRGYDLDGGYAEAVVADARFALALPEAYTPAEAAPLLCAGLIGYRAYRMAGGARRLGLYGFGAAAHLLAQVAHHQGREVYAFTRPGDTASQEFARSLGVDWAGGSDESPPAPLDAALLFAPVGALVPKALGEVRKGGRVICAGIHMSDIPAFAYRLLWEERSLQSVANLTRQDGVEFLALAARQKLSVRTTCYPLEEANTALADLREGRLEGSAVLEMG